MTAKATKILRCAIYTRKSTEHGLELEFNSLDAQREACEAYIKSQASEGWRVLHQAYDDPAYSGGNMERPALRKLLSDIDAGLIDVVVVYKIDRLTRALADFAKLVEAFDAKSVTFVAVTQQFNTTTSMGRLTLNVLLSFAQFERELASERVRDKIAASRRKGKWTGGTIPLGYDCKDKKLVVNESEAKTVRIIFDCYLTLGSMQKLIDELDKRSIVTKSHTKRNTKTFGRVPFRYGSLAYLLKNRTYLGEMGHKGSWFDGEHDAIIDRETFERVQLLMRTNTVDRVQRRRESPSLLSGLLFDDRGNRMSPSFTAKNGVRYRFYVSGAVLRGRKADAGSVTRVSAPDLEKIIIDSIGNRPQCEASETTMPSRREIIEQCVSRIEIYSQHISITLRSEGETFDTIKIAWTKPPTNGLAKIEDSKSSDADAPDQRMLQAIVRSHVWLRQLNDGTYQSIESLARSVGLHPKVIRNGLRLAFLPPDITDAVLQNRARPTASLNEVSKTLPASWQAQRSYFTGKLPIV